MQALAGLLQRPVVIFVGGWAAGKALDEAYDATKGYLKTPPPDVAQQQKILAENDKAIKQQQQLMELQKQHIGDLSNQRERIQGEIDDLQRHMKYKK